MRAIIIALTLAVLALSGSSVRLWENYYASRASGRAQTCQAFEGQYNAFAKIIRSGERSARQLAYYKEHPDELKQALANSEKSLRVLRSSIPDYC